MITHDTAPAPADYQRVAAAIRFLEQQHPRQPGLAEVARHVGLSESRTQRVFTAWAGISPKRYVQHLTADHSTALLQQGRSVLDAAYTAGLSGPGRLHDLMVNVHAATPGEVGTGGAALQVAWAEAETPFGDALIAVTERGICGMHFTGALLPADALADLQRRWPNAEFHHAPGRVRDVAAQLFSADRAAPVSVLVSGTNFQIQVWRALLRIPAGSVATYDDVARSIGAPRSHRAVGAAIGRNPVAVLIPCHRVIRKDGALGGYHWGVERKAALLAWEAMG
jgi:AraC family transcriptional regulator, regulatory protein of adaptative response / methylated-DNA-[protein]-cysteine methyltransferase